jgi:hypothetical protein
MTRRPRARVVLSTCLALVALAGARDASADPTKAQCVEADTSAQTERRGELFRAAREHLEICSKPACPTLVREDCVQRLSDLDAIAPSIVFAAKDGAGEDLIAVRVTMDGAPFATQLAGSALPVDPGLHTFRFEVEGVPPVEKKVVVREGEKGRQVSVVLSASPALPVVVAAPPATAPPEHGTTSTWGAQKTAAVVVGAVGVAGLVMGAVTGGLSFSAWSSSQSECGSGGCTDHAKALSDHDSAVTDATLSDVGFIAGGVLVAAGVLLYATAPKSSSTTGAVRVVPRVGSSGGGLGLEGQF